MTRQVWIDLETTGLNPQTDLILEIGVVITAGVELTTVWEYSSPVKVDVEAARALCVPYVLDMHEKNGLWDDLLLNAKPLSEIVETICHEVHSHGAFGGPAGGFSVHFDRAFLKEQAPQIDLLFNHRCFDVSTIKDWFKRFKGEELPGFALPAHRALPDCFEAIHTMRALRGRVL